MATSGSTDFLATRDDIITEALEQMGVLAEGQTPSADQLTSMSRTLNMLVKAWQGEGLNLFAVQKMYVYLEKEKSEYSLAASSIDHCALEYNRTTTTAAAIATDTTIEVTSITGISASDSIGVELSDGTMQWNVVNGAPTGTTITLTTALSGAVSSGATVYTYTTKANRPMKIMNVMLTDAVSEQDTPIWTMSRQEYVELPSKTTDGAVNQVYYDPQVAAGSLFVWPQSDTVNKYLTLWVQRSLEDFDAATDDADFPQEWYLPLALGLAAVSCTKYGVPRFERTYIGQLAQHYKTIAESFDAEDGFQLQPENR